MAFVAHRWRIPRELPKVDMAMDDGPVAFLFSVIIRGSVILGVERCGANADKPAAEQWRPSVRGGTVAYVRKFSLFHGQ
jgi:hypothetical protein